MSTICHVHGMDNVVADALSRIETNALLTGQPANVWNLLLSLRHKLLIHRFAHSSLHQLLPSLQKQCPSSSTDPLYCDTSTGTRPLVPLPWRCIVFDSLHGLSHPGIQATQKLITARFVWPGINADVCRWTRSCIQFQYAKVQRHTTAPLSTFPVPDTHFDVIHIDLIGPLPLSQGFNYLLTYVDHYTRWPEAIPLTSITAEAVAQAFLAGWISGFGVPSTIVTDRGRQFESRLCTPLMSLLGSKELVLPPITLKLMVWLKDFCDNSKLLLKHNLLQTHGWIHFHLYSSEYTPLSKRTPPQHEHEQRWYMALPGEFFTFSPTTSLPDPSGFVMQIKSLSVYSTSTTLNYSTQQ